MNVFRHVTDASAVLPLIATQSLESGTLFYAIITTRHASGVLTVPSLLLAGTDDYCTLFWLTETTKVF